MNPLPTSLLAVSLALGERDLGWFYVAGKQTEDGFDDEDVRIAHTLGALAALIHENALLSEEIRSEAASLKRQLTEPGRVYN